MVKYPWSNDALSLKTKRCLVSITERDHIFHIQFSRDDYSIWPSYKGHENNTTSFTRSWRWQWENFGSWLSWLMLYLIHQFQSFADEYFCNRSVHSSGVLMPADSPRGLLQKDSFTSFWSRCVESNMNQLSDKRYICVNFINSLSLNRAS